jgi:hypothetical protein
VPPGSVLDRRAWAILADTHPGRTFLIVDAPPDDEAERVVRALGFDLAAPCLPIRTALRAMTACPLLPTVPSSTSLLSVGDGADPRLHAILITSWNEWNEDTAIEPLSPAPPTADDASRDGKRDKLRLRRADQRRGMPRGGRGLRGQHGRSKDVRLGMAQNGFGPHEHRRIKPPVTGRAPILVVEGRRF